MPILVNGQLASEIGVQDRGLAYGDGVFETIAVSTNKLQFWPQHWQRLSLGLQRLGFDCDLNLLQQAIETDIQQLLSRHSAQQAVLKITVTRGTGGRGYLPPENDQTNRIIQLSDWPAGREHLASEGIRVRICDHVWGQNRALAGLKHLNRLDQVLARQEWQTSDWHEGIMLNQQGRVQSGVMSNVFIEAQGQLYTPANDTAGIDGIMAAQVVMLAKRLGIAVTRQAVSVAQLESADGVFLTNSLNGIWPVTVLQQQTYAIGPMTQRLQQALAGHIADHSQTLMQPSLSQC